MTVSIKGMTDTHVTVAGWGVKFGGQDLDGETFTPQTEFMLDLVPVKPVLYDHAQRKVKHFLGKVTKAELLDEGIWVEAELDRHAEYVDHVIRLVEKGALGWSSGSVGHLTRREGGIIRAWPVVEWSLTPTPAEPRTVGVEVIKSLIERDPSFGALLPDSAAKAMDEGDLQPTDAMVAEAERGLAWREEFGRGGTMVGVARARDIANRRSLSPETWRRMYSFFARHEVDKQGKGFKEGEEGYPSAGRIAWALWGGDPGFSRSKMMVDKLDAEEEKTVSSKGKGKSKLQPSAAMVSEAEQGLAWREEFGRGGTAFSVALAEDITGGEEIPVETWGRMRSLFEANAGDKEKPGFNPGEEGYPSNGRIAWALWGGDEAFERSKMVTDEMASARRAERDDQMGAAPRMAGDNTDKVQGPMSGYGEKSVTSAGALLPEAKAATFAARADGVQHNVVENPVTEENGTMSDTKSAEAVDYGALLSEIKSLRSELSGQPPVNAPAVNLKSKRGDDETKAMAYYIRTGDAGALGATKASNDTDMNVGTNADGGFAVPTGHFQEIVAKRDEMRIDTRLGVRQIPGRGLTVNVPIDDETDGEFITKAEAATFDRDAPAIGRVQMTLVKYTKTIQISDELMQDEDSNLMAFLNNWIGRALGKTYNSLFLTELRAGGTAALTLDSASAIGVTEIPELAYKLKPEYRDGAAWVISNDTEGKIRALASSNEFQFAPSQLTRSGSPELWGFPVAVSSYGSSVGASAKSLIFGNYSYVGVRDSGLQFLRNPYLLANSGQTALHYYFRVVYKVLQAEAIVYATHPSA